MAHAGPRVMDRRCSIRREWCGPLPLRQAVKEARARYRHARGRNWQPELWENARALHAAALCRGLDVIRSWDWDDITPQQRANRVAAAKRNGPIFARQVRENQVMRALAKWKGIP